MIGLLEMYGIHFTSHFPVNKTLAGYYFNSFLMYIKRVVFEMNTNLQTS